MQRLQNIFTLIGFKLTWTACIFGELYYNSLIGFVFGIFFLIIFFTYQKNKISVFFTIVVFSLIGYTFDSFLSFCNLYNINSNQYFLYLPLWFVILWPSFSCLLIDIFKFLKNSKILSILIGGFLGPVSYYSGTLIGLAEVQNSSVFVLISFFWASLFFFYFNYIANKELFR